MPKQVPNTAPGTFFCKFIFLGLVIPCIFNFFQHGDFFPQRGQFEYLAAGPVSAQSLANHQQQPNPIFPLLEVYSAFFQLQIPLATLYSSPKDPVTADDYLEKILEIDAKQATSQQGLSQMISELERLTSEQTIKEHTSDFPLEAVDSSTARESRIAAPQEGTEENSITPEEFLKIWAVAWSAQNSEAYLRLYADEFIPANNLSRQAWEQQRRQRINQPASIRVELSDFSITGQSAQGLQIDLVQSYRSDRYADKTRKRFELTRVGGSWKILAERSLGAL